MQKDSREDKDLRAYFDQIKEDLSSYLNKRIELFKLRSYEKISALGSYLAYSLIIFMLAFNIFFLFMLILGFLFGELLNSYALGFGVLILTPVILLIVCIAFGKKIRIIIVNKFIEVIRKIEKDEE